MAQNPNYPKVGAAWNGDLNSSISIKLNNGKYITLWPTRQKTSDKSPDYNATMKLEDAEAMGLLDTPEYHGENKPQKSFGI